jgi:hypothetical protein
VEDHCPSLGGVRRTDLSVTLAVDDALGSYEWPLTDTAVPATAKFALPLSTIARKDCGGVPASVGARSYARARRESVWGVRIDAWQQSHARKLVGGRASDRTDGDNCSVIGRRAAI